MTDQERARRNLNPTPEARVAMIVWGDEYSKQGGGSMATAKAFDKPVWVIKMRDARWVYLFLHDIQAGCGDDDCYCRRQEGESCRPCEQWISSDWEYKVSRSAEWEMLSVS